MTSFFSTVPVAHALYEAPKEMGLNLDWSGDLDNDLQTFVTWHAPESLVLAGLLDEKQLTSKASDVCAVVNQFLVDGGFDKVQLADKGTGNMLYMAAIMKLLGQFYEEGVLDYRLPKIKRPAFRLPKSAVKHYEYGLTRVVEVPTQSGFSLLISQPTRVVNHYMLEAWANIIYGMKEIDGNGAVLPMAVIENTDIDVSALTGMASGNWVIMEALMAARFGLSNKEVKFETAFAASAMFYGMKEYNKPEVGDYLADHGLYLALKFGKEYFPLAAGIVDATDLSEETVH